MKPPFVRRRLPGAHHRPFGRGRRKWIVLRGARPHTRLPRRPLVREIGCIARARTHTCPFQPEKPSPVASVTSVRSVVRLLHFFPTHHKCPSVRQYQRPSSSAGEASVFSPNRLTCSN